MNNKGIRIFKYEILKIKNKKKREFKKKKISTPFTEV